MADEVIELDADTIAIKQYLRIKHTEDDAFLSAQVEASKFYIKNVTGVEYTAVDLTYKNLIMYMVQNVYDNRSAITEKSVNEMPYTITNMLNHIAIRGALPVVEEVV